MILTDTSVVIDFLRTGDPKMRQVFVTFDAAVCGVTRAEVLHGTRDPADFQRLVAALNAFQQVPLPESLWDIAGQNLAGLRAAGVSVPFGDAVIATVSLENNLELWTRDTQFGMIQKVLPQLRLFQEPP